MGAPPASYVALVVGVLGVRLLKAFGLVRPGDDSSPERVPRAPSEEVAD